ncbi:AAA family ATPase [Pseudomonas sp. URMO17WK12:I2]|uniref:AAA family ATPase n=1 Tax=Pseudomonas sp. URMO17WK12:I2 TaxID=1261623 RepID=UPI000DABBEEF|nr:AAA family ATPase [Pseudomonas sp. URMO17WK12:I2]PZW40190.1 AAA ATPase-like protein [Pseudomonas sp. URMO17WK12:I2]
MRLDKIRIGSEKVGDKQRFKNLKNVEISFGTKEWITVVIGWNGTGKSNVLEAIATLFRDLIMEKDRWGNKDRPSFAYKLRYVCQGKAIEIDADPDRKADWYEISYLVLDKNSSELPSIEGYESIRFSQFKKQKDDFLPRYVFGYYSGNSDRMQSVFRPYLQQYDKKLRNVKSEDPGLRRLFYALPVHSQFVLLAFVLQQDELVKAFLNDQLGLDTDAESESVDSVLLVLNEPSWSLNKGKVPKGKYGACQDNPDIFWGAEGVVRGFLDRVHKVATAPVHNTRKDESTFWNKKNREYVYLFVKDLDRLAQLIGDQSPREFFRDLESTYVSELISEVRIRVKLKKNDGSVTFRELSEGEQQLLTVLGLLRFTAEEESLFLLDEPDTHLNPRWSVDYIGYLNRFITSGSSAESSSHIVLTTHNPIAIAELSREQVQILYRNKTDTTVMATRPEQAPRGMGYSGVITSDLFGLGSSLDKKTTEDLLNLHKLSSKEQPLTKDEKIELRHLRQKIERLDFNFASDDRMEREFLRARFDLIKSQDELDAPILTKKNRESALSALVKALLASDKEDD